MIDHIHKIINTEPESIESAKVPWTNPVQEDFHVVVYRDNYPVTEGHLLFVPKCNTVGVLRDVLEDAIKHGIQKVNEGEWDGFNIGMNVGKAAGQTIDWPHVHLIPRRQGDMDDPRGGVRHVIPSKGNYRK
jgi:diadenosine tetraphosphate (Ap4A) HIT family hydrolase